MMHACASAAKLHGGGPILTRGSPAAQRPLFGSGYHHLGPSSAACPDGSGLRIETSWSMLGGAQVTGRKAMPCAVSPVVTKRHSAIRSFRARATIMVLRVPPRASAVRARYHYASA